MKRFVLLAAFATLLLSNSDCSTKPSTTTRYKGRLEISAICMNYTISILEGKIPASSITDNWTDETTHRSYRKVFKLGNPCDFPASIKQGDEFYFTVIDMPGEKQCAVCMAYYPTPSKKLSIKIVP